MTGAERQRNGVAGKTAIITGGGSPEGGIGRSIALLLAAEGANVAVVDIDAARAEEVAHLIRSSGGQAIAVTADVSMPDICRQVAKTVLEAFGGIQILINNVGVSRSAQSLIDLDLADWSRTFDINLKSAVALSSAALPAMKAAGGGSIVNIASIAGMQAYGGTAYGPSKAALIAFTRETAVMHGRDGVRANAIAPGHVYTPHVGQMFTEELRAARRAIGPLGIEGDAGDVAQAALFLASDAARFITGVLLPVDGGVTALGPMAGHDMLARG